MEFSDYHAIHKLITRYAQCADEADVRGIAKLYSRCRLINPDGSIFDVAKLGEDAYFNWYSKIIRWDPKNGRPKTRRMVGTIIIDDDGPLRAKGQHCVVCYQATDKLPLQPIAAATLYDRFEKIDGTWWLVERREDLELVGDLSHHVHMDRVADY